MTLPPNALVIYESKLKTCCGAGTLTEEEVAFERTLKKLQEEFKDITVWRINLCTSPQQFFENPKVAQKYQKHGTAILPLLFYKGKVISSRTIPSYEELKELILAAGGVS